MIAAQRQEQEGEPKCPPPKNQLGKLRHPAGKDLKQYRALALDFPRQGLGETHRCPHDDEDMCFGLMEGITLVQLFPQDPAHLGPAQVHLLRHDALC